MADVILIQPKLGYVDYLIYKSILPSALLSIARFVDQDYTVKVLHQRINKNWKKHLLKELNQRKLYEVRGHKPSHNGVMRYRCISQVSLQDALRSKK